MDQKSNFYDVIVIGAGVIGSATAYECAKSGKKTALLDQFPIPHSRGSSAGHSRIIRYAHSQCSELTKIMKDSFAEWLTIQNKADVQLFKPAKLLSFSNVRGNTLQRMYSASKQCGGNAVYKTAKNINAEYNLNLPANTNCLEDSSAGVLLADKCIFSLLKLFEFHNGTIIGNWPVSNIVRLSDNLVKVEGTRGHLTSHKLIICAGPWTSDHLIPLGIDLPLKPVKVAVYYWKVLHGEATFSFMHEKEKFTMYGLPAIEYPGMMKLAGHHGIIAHPNDRDNVDYSEIRKICIDYVKENFPCLQPYPSVEESCMYTITPDEEMILDRHPKYPNILFACGFSGYGFKLAPMVANYLHKMAFAPHTLDPSVNLEPFKMNRFTMSVPSSRL